MNKKVLTSATLELVQRIQSEWPENISEEDIYKLAKAPDSVVRCAIERMFDIPIMSLEQLFEEICKYTKNKEDDILLWSDLQRVNKSEFIKTNLTMRDVKDVINMKTFIRDQKIEGKHIELPIRQSLSIILKGLKDDIFVKKAHGWVLFLSDVVRHDNLCFLKLYRDDNGDLSLLINDRDGSAFLHSHCSVFSKI